MGDSQGNWYDDDHSDGDGWCDGDDYDHGEVHYCDDDDDDSDDDDDDVDDDDDDDDDDVFRYHKI